LWRSDLGCWLAIVCASVLSSLRCHVMAHIQLNRLPAGLETVLRVQVQWMAHQMSSTCHVRALSLDDPKDWSKVVSTARKDFKVPVPGNPMFPDTTNQEGMEPQVLFLLSEKQEGGRHILHSILFKASCLKITFQILWPSISPKICLFLGTSVDRCRACHYDALKMPCFSEMARCEKLVELATHPVAASSRSSNSSK
jgi:hypothetical protein